MIKRDR